MAAGRGPAGIAGVRAARSRLALRSACWLLGLQRFTQAGRPRRDYAGTIPTRAIGRDSGTPASRNSGLLLSTRVGRPFATQASGRPLALRDARPAVGNPSRLT